MSDNITTFEKLQTKIYDNPKDGAIAIAREIAEVIRNNNQQSKNTVLGLATGSSPRVLYEELVRMHKEEILNFERVVTFNLDEYYPMNPLAIQSYVRYMNEALFSHINIRKENIHMPNGQVALNDITRYCASYEKQIKGSGGIDIQILGLGRTGHIGFNEPGSTDRTITRLVTLDRITRSDASEAFGGEQNVPRKAITMGVRTILKAKKIYIMAWGDNKAPSVKQMLEGPVSEALPASFLQNHPDTTVVIDRNAAERLTRFNEPWLLQSCDWTDNLVKKAIVWLCQQVKKPILKLVEQDYMEHGLSELLTEQGPAYLINIRVFNMLQHTITGWPGGKPEADDSQRPERKDPASKRVLIFSPHPDDDVISMGATLMRLVEQGHQVHVVYQVSGNIAVADEEALRYAEYSEDLNVSHGKGRSPDFAAIKKFLQEKSDGDIDISEVRRIKGLIRRGEARAAARYCGVEDKNVHFLDMPFYESGTVTKKPLSEDDIILINDIILEIKPHQIYAAGDLADPHGTHRVCLEAIMESIRRIKDEKFMKDCWVWLYRGAWLEWEIPEIEMAVPISPEELINKRMAIFKHQSQKDGVMFQGKDEREFWQRAEDRNRETAERYDALGMAEYEAIEAFVRWDFMNNE